MYIDATEAARRLNVSKTTLYAYVSRRLVRSRPIPGTRKHEYAVQDVEALLQRRRARRDPGAAVSEALGFHGLPVLDSAITLIADGRLHYRGHDAVALAEEATLEDVAAILWDGEVGRESVRARGGVSAKLPLIEAFHAHLAVAGAADPAAFTLAPDMVRAVGSRILRGLAAVAVGERQCTDSIAATLARGWDCPRGRKRIEAALIVCADHGLNASAFTARCVASAGATPYMAVTGGLAALRGHKHGGNTERVADLLDEPGSPHDVVAARLRRGESIPGFGHPLYPDGDPRARKLLELAPSGSATRRGHGFAHAGAELVGQQPAVDLALVVLARALKLPAVAPLALFALGRTVGLVAHILEQYEGGALIRPRARYVGPAPSIGNVLG